MFNFIDIYSFIPESGCVGMGTSVLLYPWAFNAVKTALHADNIMKKINLLFYNMLC